MTSEILQVRRRYRMFKELDSDLRAIFPHISLPTLCAPRVSGQRRHSLDNFNPLCQSVVEERRLCLERYLRALVARNEVWLSSRFVQFLDDSPAPSLGVQIQLAALSNQVSSMRTGCFELEQKLEMAEEVIGSAMSLIVQLEDRIEQLSGGRPVAKPDKAQHAEEGRSRAIEKVRLPHGLKFGPCTV